MHGQSRKLFIHFVDSVANERGECVIYKSTLKRMQQLLILNTTLLWLLGP